MYREGVFKISFFISIFMHLTIFTLASFIGPKIRHIHFGPIYQVRLVSLPVIKARPKVFKKEKRVARAKTAKKKAIPLVKGKKKMGRIGKKEVKGAKNNISKLIEAKVKQIEERLAKKRVEMAIAGIEARLKGSGISVGSYQGKIPANLGLKFQIYYQEIWEKIKGNWVLPTFLLKGKEAVEAVVVVKIAKNGDIIDKFFEKKSGISVFDESVMEAIDHSSPLPPLPQGYISPYHELGIRFRWKKEK